ncbi:m-AAA protease-interacting protein 1, mitochondrial-like [Gigantopelta aegis]|uniref:m-AAA protease-interacting protein 1, mitochondrial-like n=1 Tax=Gigantopelta aegis TaxID=1735272 RepID=UPI001B88D39E|nr:m-AAA protease-interacting protein 1, mitochondrial-like [Gigantopelta aegis]
MAFSSVISRASLLYLTFRPTVAKAASKFAKVTSSTTKRNLVLLQHIAKSSCRNRLLSTSVSGCQTVNVTPYSSRRQHTVSHKSHVALLFSRPFSSDGYDNDRESSGASRTPLQLMDFPRIWWPNPIKWFKNKLFTVLITGYFDESFNMDSFLDGSLGAVAHVSTCISNGDFSALKGLVTSEAIEEVQKSYEHLDVKQRRFLSVNPKDIFYMFIYEIGMIFDSSTNQRFVEITVALQGFHDYHEVIQTPVAKYLEIFRENVEQMYICNYRFSREYTKGVESEWTISKLNHFTPWEDYRT